MDTDTKIKRKDKLNLLRNLIEIYIRLGYDISDLIGRPLWNFDADGLQRVMDIMNKEYKEIYNEDWII